MAGKELVYTQQLRKLDKEFQDTIRLPSTDPQLLYRLKTLESLLSTLITTLNYTTSLSDEITKPNQLLVQCRLLQRKIENRKKEVQGERREEGGDLDGLVMQEVEMRLEKVQMQVEKMRDLLAEQTTETAHYKALSSDLQSELALKSDLLSSQSSALTASQSQFHSLSDQLLSQQTQISTLESSLLTANKEKTELESTIGELKSSMDRLQQGFQEELGRYKERYDRELEEARVLWEKQTVKICELSPSYLELRKKLELQIDVNKDLHSRLSQEVHDSNQLREESIRLQRRIDHLTSQLASTTHDLHLLDLALTQVLSSASPSQANTPKTSPSRTPSREKTLLDEIERLKNYISSLENQPKQGNFGENNEKQEKIIEMMKSEK